MKNIIQTAEQLLGRKLTANDGYTTDEIKQAENMLGLTMPEALKHFYLSVGKVEVLASSFQRFLPLDELQSDGEKIIFLAENQEVCIWATTIHDTTIWVKYSDDEGWITEPIGLMDFILLTMYYNCAQGGFEFSGIAENEEAYPAILEYVQKEWNKVVQYNALIIYAYQDNLIWYFYKADNTPTDDGIFLSCRTIRNNKWRKKKTTYQILIARFGELMIWGYMPPNPLSISILWAVTSMRGLMWTVRVFLLTNSLLHGRDFAILIQMK